MSVKTRTRRVIYSVDVLRRIAPLVLLVLPLSPACVCHRNDGDTAPTEASAPSSSSADAPQPVTWDLQLRHHTLEAYGNTTPLSVSQEFEDPVPQVMPALEKAAEARGLDPVKLRVERDVPYGQVTRLMQAGIGARIGTWEVMSIGADGSMHGVVVKAPGALPRGQCWMRAWVGPDQRVLVGGYGKTEGLPDGGNDMVGTLVLPAVDRVAWEKVIDVVRRLDAACPTGQLRVYAQPAGAWGGVFDLVLGFHDANPPPHVREILMQVPSLGPMDSTLDVIK
jgi:hypothetical protein